MSPKVRTALLLALAALLRVLRGAVRWDEVAWQYAAYPAPTVEALRAGDLATALTTWVGLHPPGWQLLHAVQEVVWPAPAVFLGTSVLLSWLAVWVWRDHPVVALLIATSPVQLSYAAEVNDYPLVALLVALAYRHHQRPWALGAIGAVAVWTHPLAALVVAAIGRREPRALGVMALSSLPLLPGAWALVTAEGTFGQPELLPLQSAVDVVERFGGLGLVMLGFAVVGAPRLRPLLVPLGLSLGAYVALVLVGVAAPHQFMYWLVFTVPLALLADAGAQGRWRTALVAVAFAQAAWFGAFDALRLKQVFAPGERGVDVALADSQPADAIYLLAPPGRNDDDKRMSSPVLWRFSPLHRLPMARAYAFAYDDHRHGQPRLVDGRFVYVNDALRPELDQAIAAHPELWLVLYEQNESLQQAVEARYGVGEPVGPDLVWRLSSE